jgi:cell division protein ZapA (FtsZ GTPase activity inhibitor)
MVPVTITIHGMVLIIIHGHGHGDSILAIIHGMDGVLDSDTARAGSIHITDTVMATVMVMVDIIADGGDLRFITPLIAVGAAVMATMAVIMAEIQPLTGPTIM